jgi:hypothetical protein
VLCFRSINSDEANLFCGAPKANSDSVAVCCFGDDAVDTAVWCNRYLFLGAAEQKCRKEDSRNGHMNARHARSFV